MMMAIVKVLASASTVSVYFLSFLYEAGHTAYHTWWRLHTVALIAERPAGKL